MCGVVGIFGSEYVAQDLYDGLVTLQHRGQDAAGMATFDGKIHMRKNFGLVRDVFHTRHMKNLTGYVGIGHTRYATIGTGDVAEVQPFTGPAPYGVILAHNGNLWNSHELKKEIFEKDRRLVNSDSDGEVLLNLLTKSLTKQLQEEGDMTTDHLKNAVASVYDRSKGAYSVVAYIAKRGMLAFRDPYGIRPLIFGKRQVGLITEYIFASESVTLDILGFEIIGDVGAGEAIFISEHDRKVHRMQIGDKKLTPCVFEYVYFARPDSMINHISVYKSRIRMGQKLAKQVMDSGLDVDVVMPVPDSSRSAALAVADAMDLRYREGLVKNRYIGRTFIMPGQKVRKKSIRYKLNAMPLEMKGKKVLLIDDSIVRGNTSRQIISLVRSAGAEKVYFASYSPPVIGQNLYGIDIPTKEELVAYNATNDEICRAIGADALFYGTIEDMFDSCVEGNPEITQLDMSCFDGVYPTGDIDDEVLRLQSESRSGERKCGRRPNSIDDEEETGLSLF